MISGATASDPDNLNLASATVSISGGFFTGDTLSFTNSGAVTGSYNSNTGVLTFTGSDTLATYDTVLQSVQFNGGENPTDYGSDTHRTLTWTVNDGTLSSAAVSATVSVAGVNDPPTLSNVATNASYTEEGAAAMLSGAVSVTDPDDLNLSSATVSITGGTFANDGDVLSASPTASISVSYNSTTETLTLTGSDTLAHYQTVLDSVTFNAGENPTNYGSDPTRTVTWTLNDGSGSFNLSTAVTETVSITNINDPPTLSNVATTANYTEEGAATTLSGAVSVSDPDNVNLASATVKVTGGTFAGDGDVLAASTTGTGITASYNATTETLTLSGADTLAHYQTVLDKVTFAAGENPTDYGSNPTRTLTWVLNDGSASNNLSTPVTSTVSVSNVNDPPTLSNVAATVNFAATQTVTISPALSVMDPDNLTLANATVSITGGKFPGDGDVLGFNTAGTSVTASYNSTTETLTLTGSDTLAHYQSVLDSVTFSSTSSDPGNSSSNPTRTLTWVVNDGSGSNNLSAAVTTTISVSPSWKAIATGAFDNAFVHGFNDDIVFQKADGTPQIWAINGTSVTSQVVLADPPASWHVITTADFGNGQSDIVWQNTNGAPLIWIMNGTTEVSAPPLPAPPASWQVVAAADFDHDGGADLLWENSDGQVLIWDMNGASYVNTVALPTVPPSWRIKATGDFFGNGQTDILWQNSDGTPLIWVMNGTTEVSAPSLGTVPSSWHIVTTGDFNGDGKADILWQNADGTPLIWIMNGTTEVTGQALPNPGASWKAIATGDFNHDGKADILFQNTDGTAMIWEMNGTSVIATVVLGNPNNASGHAQTDSVTSVGNAMPLSAPDTAGGNATSAPPNAVVRTAAADPTYNPALLNQYAAAGFGSAGVIDTGTGSHIGSNPTLPGGDPVNLTTPGDSPRWGQHP